MLFTHPYPSREGIQILRFALNDILLDDILLNDRKILKV